MTRINSALGRGVLMIAHCAGMIDLVGLPVWVGALITRYHFDPQRAGLLATLFLGSAVLSSLFFAPIFNRLSARVAATAGYGIASIAFLLLSATTHYPYMALLHALAGAAAGCGLSFTHGTIGRSVNPHRLFALVGLSLGVFSIAFLAITPAPIAASGGWILFAVFTAIMLTAATASALAFPVPEHRRNVHPAVVPAERLATAVWFCMFGVASLALVQAMTFSFVEPIGLSRGFGAAAIAGLLPAVGVVNLVPAPLAALLERRVSVQRVLLIGSLLQAGLAFAVTHAVSFGLYACAVAGFVSVMIFTHTFAFGVLAKLDPTGRAVAATPAMIMVGSALGPIIGGTLAKSTGYGSLGIAAILFDALAFCCFLRIAVRSQLVHRRSASSKRVPN